MRLEFSNPAQEPFLVCAGVMVHADKKLVAIERHLDSLVARHIPEPQRDGFVFHAKEIFNGGGKVFDRDEWPIERRLKIAADLAAIPRKFKLPLAFGWVERQRLPYYKPFPDDMSEHDRAAITHTVAFLNCAMVSEHWIRREASDEVAMMIVGRQ